MDTTLPSPSRTILGLCETLSQTYGVSSKIDPHDFIFLGGEGAGRRTEEQAASEYFHGGAATAQLLRGTIGELWNPDDAFSFLDFASGYGRVTRHLRHAFPHAEITACDIHEKAVDFLRGIGIKAFQSSNTPENLLAKSRFDLVVALSFFTHMPRRTWTRWIHALSNLVAPGGALIFTTHGMTSLAYIGRPVHLDDDGYWFAPMSEQKDLDTEEYGTTVTLFDFVYRALRPESLEMMKFHAAGMGYEDLYVLRKPTNELIYKAQIVAVVQQPLFVRGLTPFTIPVTVGNAGLRGWVSEAQTFTLGAKLLSPDGTMMYSTRAIFKTDVPPGTSANVDLVACFPNFPLGTYRFVIDVVKERYFWFGDRGSPVLSIPIRVVG